MFSRLDLEERIKKLYEIDDITPMMKTQIDRFIRTDGMSYRDIARALAYFCVILGNKPELKFGIAIVPSVKEAANAYFDEKARQIKKQEADVARKKLKNDNNIIICKTVSTKRHKENKIDLSVITGEDTDE